MSKNFADLCYACRVGDTDNVDRLISTGVNLNAVDQFDNSPLFLASLCGHETVVKLLLSRGAVCDRDRYEGARCIYGALTDSIRDILLRYDISKAVDVNQPFTMHISSLIKDDFFLDTCDLSWSFHDNIRAIECLQLHKFILASRCAQLNLGLMSNWTGRHNFELPKGCSMKEMKILVKFIYLLPVLHEIDYEQYSSLIALSREWGMELLAEFLNKAQHILDPSEKSMFMATFQYKFMELAREQLCTFVNDAILKSSIILNSHEELDQGQNIILKECLAFPDVLLMVKNLKDEQRVFPCHLAILSRAHYFKLMFTLPFLERTLYKSQKKSKDSGNSSPLPLISLPSCDFEVAVIIIRYLYYDSSEIPWYNAIDVLLMADMLMEDRLKSMAAVVLTQSKELLKCCSIFDILSVAWETRMERLEHFVAKVIAQKIRKYSNDPALKEAILQSSKRISARQETDTIELVDDIRFYLLEKYAFELEDIEVLSSEQDLGLLKSSGILEYQQDMSVIENILDALSLQA
ncbi:hypothetical protein HG535_0F02650 [Zygotorulaspora mrakii]|uniref:BTB domain-containing protein n=1 Tax=Zygotorulaspora mrakii TaxID=42260 RepID=A0A7H9B5V8_ZYGMR|nr:uncharacterized protein HG535_0F02650 [Zygotorulaspora mrakii]QLG73754.1 hypothetical protein HG535_0F02650 [Zygotorulaspora mrakii]